MQGKKKRDAAVVDALKKLHEEEAEARNEVTPEFEEIESSGDLLQEKDVDVIF